MYFALQGNFPPLTANPDNYDLLPTNHFNIGMIVSYAHTFRF